MKTVLCAVQFFRGNLFDKTHRGPDSRIYPLLCGERNGYVRILSDFSLIEGGREACFPAPLLYNINLRS